MQQSKEMTWWNIAPLLLKLKVGIHHSISIFYGSLDQVPDELCKVSNGQVKATFSFSENRNVVHGEINSVFTCCSSSRFGKNPKEKLLSPQRRHPEAQLSHIRYDKRSNILLERGGFKRRRRRIWIWRPPFTHPPGARQEGKWRRSWGRQSEAGHVTRPPMLFEGVGGAYIKSGVHSW